MEFQPLLEVHIVWWFTTVDGVTQSGSLFLEHVTFDLLFERQVLLSKAVIFLLKVFNQFDEFFVILTAGFAASAVLIGLWW